VTFRFYDPARDSVEHLATLNEWEPRLQSWWASQLAKRLWVPQNLLLACIEDQAVGMALLFDGGFPILMVDGVYIQPAHRSLSNARAFLRVIDAEMQRRGVPLYLSHAPQRLAHVMKRYGFQQLVPHEHLVMGKVPGSP